MIVLALDSTFDTEQEHGSVALARGGELLDACALPPGWRSTSLHQEIARMLERHSLAVREIDGYAVTSGPGSFTGVRLGLAAVKGLAEVHGKPIVTLSTLETLAAAAGMEAKLPIGVVVAPIVDARRGQVFGGLYRREEEQWIALAADSVSSLAVFLSRVILCRVNELKGRLVFCGTNLAPYVAAIEQAGLGDVRRIEVTGGLAGVLARIATLRLKQGQGVEAARAEANYVRLSDPELFWKG